MTSADFNPLYVELPKGPYHSPSFIKRVSEVDFSALRGFRSVYFYGQAAYDRIMEQQAVKNLHQFPVYSDTLFVDFDDGEGSRDKFKAILDTAGASYELYFSGKKGYHFHIPIEPMWGETVPMSQKVWVQSLGLDTVDTSIYRHTGLFRLPGTVHQDTGKKKSLVERREGRVLEIPIVELDEEALYGVPEDSLAIVKACSTIHRVAAVGALPGHRHNTLLAIAKNLLEAGATQATCIDVCSIVNDMFAEPKSDEEIRQCVKRAVNWHRNGPSPSTPLHEARG